MQRILVIQTAFIGDVILATALLEKLHSYYPKAQLDFLVRKNNESLFKNHPYLHRVLTLNKKKKIRSLFQNWKYIRRQKYDLLVNAHRFLSSGFLSMYSGAKEVIGFQKNPCARFFSKAIPHEFSKPGMPVIHELDRNQKLIEHLSDAQAAPMRLYPSSMDREILPKNEYYICIAPSSLWFTKQYPKDQWVAFLKKLNPNIHVYLLGSAEEQAYCNSIIQSAKSARAVNMAGKLSLLQAAALMENAQMNYVNDSAPLHLASAMNAPVTALFCSTVPSFGFGPRSDNAHILQTADPLACKPCGLHGHKNCPKKHFDCAKISTAQLIEKLPK